MAVTVKLKAEPGATLAGVPVIVRFGVTVTTPSTASLLLLVGSGRKGKVPDVVTRPVVTVTPLGELVAARLIGERPPEAAALTWKAINTKLPGPVLVAGRPEDTMEIPIWP